MKRVFLLLILSSLAACSYNNKLDDAKCSFYGPEGSQGYNYCRQRLEEDRKQSLNNYFQAKDPNDPNAKCSYNGLFSQQCEPSSGW